MIEYMDEKSNYKEHRDNHVRYRIIQKVKSDLEKISKELWTYLMIGLFVIWWKNKFLKIQKLLKLKNDLEMKLIL